MSKRVFVVDDPNVASEVEALLRSRGLTKQNTSNTPQPSEDDSFPFLRRMGTTTSKAQPKKVSPSPFPWRDGDEAPVVGSSPFSWRDGVTTPNHEYRSMGPGIRGIERIPQMKRSTMERSIMETLRRAMTQPSRTPYESSCGNFNPEPHPTSRLFVNGGCGGFIPADARDLAMGRQLYTSNGCGGFEPVAQRPIGGCGGWPAPSYGGCGGTMHSIGGCGGWSTPSYGGCGGTTYRSC